jgi:hypothetical protein
MVCKHALADRNRLAIVLETLAWMAADGGAHKRAATPLGCAGRVRESLATQVLAQFREQHQGDLELVALGAACGIEKCEPGRRIRFCACQRLYLIAESIRSSCLADFSQAKTVSMSSASWLSSGIT